MASALAKWQRQTFILDCFYSTPASRQKENRRVESSCRFNYFLKGNSVFLLMLIFINIHFVGNGMNLKRKSKSKKIFPWLFCFLELCCFSFLSVPLIIWLDQDNRVSSGEAFRFNFTWALSQNSSTVIVCIFAILKWGWPLSPNWRCKARNCRGAGC